MVIDTSAIIAILNLEPGATILANAIASDSVRLMSMETALELSIIVKARKEEAGIRELDFFLYKVAINLVNFDENQLKIARYGGMATIREFYCHIPLKALLCLNFINYGVERIQNQVLEVFDLDRDCSSQND